MLEHDWKYTFNGNDLDEDYMHSVKCTECGLNFSANALTSVIKFKMLAPLCQNIHTRLLNLLEMYL